MQSPGFDLHVVFCIGTPDGDMIVSARATDGNVSNNATNRVLMALEIISFRPGAKPGLFFEVNSGRLAFLFQSGRYP